MGDDNNGPPLSRRVPGAARTAAPSASVRPALPAELLERMRAAVEAAHAEVEEEVAAPPADPARQPRVAGRPNHSARPQPPVPPSQRPPAANDEQKPQGRLTQPSRPAVPPGAGSDPEPPTEQLPRLNGAARGGLASPAVSDSGNLRGRTTRADRVKADRARARAAKADRARAERAARADQAKADQARAEAVQLDRASAAAAQAERERAAQADRDRAAQADRQRAAKADRDRAAQAERDRAAKAERDRAAQAERERAAKAERDRAAQADRAIRTERDQVAPAPASHRTADAVRVPADKRPQQSLQQRKTHGRWRYRATGLGAAAVLVLAGGGLALMLSSHSAAPRQAHHGMTRAERRAQVSLRTIAAGWAEQQLNPGTTIACDPAMCAALNAAGFPESDLHTLSQTSPYPLNSDVVAETAQVRGLFGSSLASNYAPEVIATFGAGAGRIEIRVIAQHGATTYRNAVSQGLASGKLIGFQLLSSNSNQFTMSATAKKQLAAGQVDLRLQILILDLASKQPLGIVDFSNDDRGATPGIPLRFVDLAEAAPSAAAHMSTAQYVLALRSVLETQTGVFVPLHAGNVRLPGGQDVFRIEFGAPSPTAVPNQKASP